MLKIQLVVLSIILILSVLGQVQQQKIQCSDQQFKQFCQRYKKDYTGDEFQKRKLIYCQNKKKIEYINSQDLTYKAKLNHLSFLSEQQLKQNSGYKALPRDPKKLMGTSRIQVGQNPESLDWRDQGIITSVKDQGSCGSCWAFSTCAYVQSRLVQLGQFDSSLDLSQQKLLECTSYSTCSGGYIEYAMKNAADNDIPRQEVYPYDPYQTHLGICLVGGVDASADLVFDHYNLNDQQIIQLLQDGPLNVGVASAGWSSYSSGAFRCASSDGVDHAVLLVGYNSEQWIIKNQWGSDWGEQGYMYITRDPSGNCKIGNSVHFMHQNRIGALFLVIMVILFMLY